MTILCEADPSGIAALSSAIASERQVRAVPDLAAAALSIQGDTDEDLVVVGRDAPIEDVVQFTQHLHAQRPGVAVILLRRSYEPMVIDAALSAGVREVIGDSPQALHEAYRRLLEARTSVSAAGAEPMHATGAESVGVAVDAAAAPLGNELFAGPDTSMPMYEASEPDAGTPVEQPRTGQVVTVFAPKGGTGKTTISTNLSAALYGDGAHRVCLVDLDLEFGDVAISLGLTPVNTLVDAVTTEVLGEVGDALRSLTTEYRPGFDCILAPIEPGDAEKIPTALVADLLAVLRQHYEYVVVDTPSQLSEKVLAALDASDHFVLLANPELPSLKNLRLTLDMLDLLGYPRSARAIVFNRADEASGLSTADVEEALKSPVTALVPASRDVPWSINHGTPIVTAKPDHAVSVAIKNLANTSIIGAVAGQGRKRRGLRGIFKGRAA